LLKNFPYYADVFLLKHLFAIIPFISLSNSDKQKINLALMEYCASNNESVDSKVIVTWIEYFSKMGVPVQKILDSIAQAKLTKKFGVTKFSDFTDILLNGKILFTYGEMMEIVNNRINKIRDFYRDKEIRIKLEEEERKKETDITTEELNKFIENISYRNEYVNKKINEFIDNLINRIERQSDYTVEVPWLIRFLNSERKK
jgi:hypothetical protein